MSLIIQDNCGRTHGGYLSHTDMSRLTGWSTPNTNQQLAFNRNGYDRLFARFDNTRPPNTGSRNCSSRGNSFSQISYNPGATHRWEL